MPRSSSSRGGPRPAISWREEGNVVVEFVGVLVVLVVPALLALLAVSSLLMAQAAVTAAVRDAGRAFVRAESVSQGRQQAEGFAHEAFEQRGVEAIVTLDFRCVVPACLSPGSRVTTTVRADVDLAPLGTSITLEESMTFPVDELREERG